MKKSSFFFLLSVIALTSIGLTACSSKEEEVIDNPNYDPLTKTVNANFVFSVSTGNTTTTTRQTSMTTQATADEKFRGIHDAHLLAFSLNEGKYVTTPQTATEAFDLGKVLDPGGLDPNGNSKNEAGEGVPLSHRIIELTLPTETNTLMFWGKAPKNGTSSEQGEIVFDASDKDISNHAFSLVPRIPKSSTSTKGEDAYLQYQTIITKALNKLTQTAITNKEVSFGADSKHIEKLNWSDYVDLTQTPLVAKTMDPSDPTGKTHVSTCGVLLGHAFVNFHNINAGEIRAGSGKAIAGMINDVYTIISSVASATPKSIQDAVAKEVGIAVKDQIDQFFKMNTAMEWIGIDQVITNAGIEEATVNLVKADEQRDLNVFPTNFNVPSGVAQLTFTPSTRQWKFEEENTHSMIGTGSAASVFNYMYPAELCYFGNSPIRVSNDPKTPNQYPDGVAAWINDKSWEGWSKNAKVTANTRSVAMQDNINYGTALLESTVRYGSKVLEDNNHAVQKAKNPTLSDNEEPNNKIELTATSFFLKGIIIGGQPQTVGWDYLAKEGTSASFNYLIYDNALPDMNIPAYTASGNKSVPNYTLVWDNWREALRGQDQSTVYVALEFINNTGKDFFGKNNKIPNGGTFYIIGKLDPTEVKDITWPGNYALPPYDSDGVTLKQRRVFIQDYMTVANFIINRESLQNAYVTVPDLRSLQISLGMSVDLEWQTGLTFDVILGQ